MDIAFSGLYCRAGCRALHLDDFVPHSKHRSFSTPLYFFIVGSALASIGSSLLSAWMAPSAKPLVGILGATATGVLGPIMFFVGHSVGGTPLFAIFSGYIGGAILAIVLLLLLKRNTQPAA